MAQELIQPQPELQRQALTLVERAQGIVIADQVTYDGACEFAKGIKELQAKAETHHRPFITHAYAAWKSGLRALASIQDPLIVAETLVKSKIGAFENAQEVLRREEEAREEAESRRAQLERIRAEEEALAVAVEQAEAINAAARRRAEEEQMEAARMAKAQGATPEEIEAILSAPLNVALVEPAPLPVELPRYVPPPRKPPGFERNKGISMRLLWRGEVTNMRELCAAIGRGECSANLVQANMPAINALAKVERDALRVPGLRAVSETNVAIRGGM